MKYVQLRDEKEQVSKERDSEESDKNEEFYKNLEKIRIKRKHETDLAIANYKIDARNKYSIPVAYSVNKMRDEQELKELRRPKKITNNDKQNKASKKQVE